MAYSQMVDNDAYWNDPAAFSAVRRTIFQEGKRQRLLLGPSWVDRTLRKTIPVQIVQCGTQKDFVEGSLASKGMLVLVDRDRNLLQLSPAAWDPMVSQAPPVPPAPRTRTTRIWDCNRRRRILSEDSFPTSPHHRKVPVGGSPVDRFHAGDGFPDRTIQEKFPQELAASLATIPARKSIPAELVVEPRPWKAMAASESIAKGCARRSCRQASVSC
ncbi:MAG: hypothetical protein IPN71_13020 [Fibrobacteres bacterium]|nr:hypothetical protein [Fibrobacterota bacterium]